MKIQEYLNKMGDEDDQDNEDLKQEVLPDLYDFITNSDDSDGIKILYDEEIKKMPYELIVGLLAEGAKGAKGSMSELAELLTTTKK